MNEPISGEEDFQNVDDNATNPTDAHNEVKRDQMSHESETTENISRPSVDSGAAVPHLQKEESKDSLSSDDLVEEEVAKSSEIGKDENSPQLMSNDDDPGNPNWRKKKRKQGKLIGVTFGGEEFVVPKTRSPFDVGRSKWTFVDFLKVIPPLVALITLFCPLPDWFYAVHFMIWRLAYNAGLGYVLFVQSRRSSFINFFARLTHPEATFYGLVKALVSVDMNGDYNYKKCPTAFNAWLAWRVLADFVLEMDLFTYMAFAIKFWEVDVFNVNVAICWLIALALWIFSYWAKLDAYRVVEDYAWYWGDFFFLVDRSLTFDRVFSISPHPMYTIGYSFYYGTSLFVQSYTVFYFSIFAHVCQLLFLNLVEEPHMKKIYPDLVSDPDTTTKTVLYDAKTGYFRKDLIVFYNFNFLRSSDVFMLIIIVYCSLTVFFDIHPLFYVVQVIVWRLIHSFGLGYILYCQSKDNKYITTYFKKGFTKLEAFQEWKKIYNLSLTMTWVTFIICAIKFYNPPASFIQHAGLFWLAQTLGLTLIAVNIWSSVSIFEVLGEFGWFYGDFFIDEVPSKLYYSGIYRFLNNPEVVTGFAGFYGIACMAGSPSIGLLALFSHVCNWIFIAKVERPHMSSLYGNQVRERSGIEYAVKSLVKETIDQAPPKFRKQVQSVQTKTKEFLDNLSSPMNKKKKKKL